MDSAALKYVKILANGSGSFGGSSTAISEDIVSMMAAVSKKRTASPTSKKKIATNKPGIFATAPIIAIVSKVIFILPPECRTRQKWLNDKDGSAPNTAIDDSDGTSTVTDFTDPSTSSDSSKIISFLESALSLGTGNEAVTACITDALNAIHDL